MADQLFPTDMGSGGSRDSLSPTVGVVPGREKLSVADPSAIGGWLPEHGGVPRVFSRGKLVRVLHLTTSPPKEARDRVDGCRERAAQDRLQSGSMGTENGRQMLERSAACWEVRAEELLRSEIGAMKQKLADRALWLSEEVDSLKPL